MVQTQQLTWDEVLADKTLVGGAIESIEDGVIYHGPISKIEMDGETIQFTCPWRARLNPKTTEWEKCADRSLHVNKIVSPQNIGDGKIFFHMPPLGSCTIFPNVTDSNRLDTRKVKGLPKNSERFLALFPNLLFDRAIAEKILVEKAFLRTEKMFKDKPADAALQDLLNCFKYDSTAEEFLWYYVEAVTGMMNLHEMVY